MDVLGNVRPPRAVRMLGGVIAWLGLLACSADDAATDAGVSTTGGDAGTPAETEATEPTDGAADAAAPGGEPSGCEAPLGEGACADRTICDVFDCGGKTAPFNHFGCPRVPCLDDADCGDGERCFAVALETACRAEAGACADVDGTCTCEGADSCGGARRAHCLPTSFYPAAQDCDPTGIDCDELPARLQMLSEAGDAFADAGAGALVDALDACAARIADAGAECSMGVRP